MKLYNSESKKVEEFVPKNKDMVTLYTCGPTVYHFAHIGNLRSYIMEDILERTLIHLGYNVKRAMNITDVGHLSSDGDSGEDKMLIGAKRENKTVLQIAGEYTEAFKEDCEKLRLKWPENVVPATSCIDEYLKIISSLLKKGYAYQSNGNIYFDTSKVEKYYRFGNQKVQDMVVGAREDVDEDIGKKNQNDFVLWFTKSKFENQALKWDSPWGVGYPGWHIECTAISLKCLGEDLDIHCGGIDNQFPHHTNEIAQTESYIGHSWCSNWFHVEHLNTKNGKMSKSKGEFLTLKRLEEMGYSPLVYKFFCLQSHYRKQLVFSEEALNSSKIAYEKLIKRIQKLEKNEDIINNEMFEEYKNKFNEAIGNDLNTSFAITVLFDVLKSDMSDNTKIELIKDFEQVLNIGLVEALEKNENTGDKEQNELIDSEFKKLIEQMIEERKKAKLEKDYAKADLIREQLLSKGVELIDTKEGTIYKINN